MSIRELLQTEVWGKRTSRKILVWFGVVVAVVVVGYVLWGALSWHWLTPGERNAARAALVQLDALQNSGSLNNEEFSARAKQAERGMDNAFRAAWTTRDRMIVGKLMGYQLDIVVKRMQMRRQALPEQRKTPLTDSDRKLNELMIASGINVNGSDRLELHKVLDKK